MLSLGLGFGQPPHLLGFGFRLEFGDPPLLRVRVWVRVHVRVRVRVTVRVGISSRVTAKVSANRVHSSLLACSGGVRLEECLGARQNPVILSSEAVRLTTS